jgi:hypothetical protein
MILHREDRVKARRHRFFGLGRVVESYLRPGVIVQEGCPIIKYGRDSRKVRCGRKAKLLNRGMRQTSRGACPPKIKTVSEIDSCWVVVPNLHNIAGSN